LRIDGLEDLTEMKLVCGEATAPINPDNVSIATELMIYRSGLGSKLSNVGNAVFALTRILSNILRESVQLKELKEYLMTEKRPSVYKIASDIADYVNYLEALGMRRVKAEARARRILAARKPAKK